MISAAVSAAHIFTEHIAKNIRNISAISVLSLDQVTG